MSVWYFVIAAVLLGVLVLAASLLPVLRRLPSMATAAVRAQRAAERAGPLRDRLAGVQQGLDTLRQRLTTLQQRVGESARRH